MTTARRTLQASRPLLDPDLGSGPLVVAHRGASATEPENTRRAFEAAIAAGADAIETDLRQTRDGAIVLFHDAEIAGRPLARLELAELRERCQAIGRPLVTWAELLELARGRIAIDAEIKQPGFEAQIAADLNQPVWRGLSFISSFRAECLRAVRHLTPQLPTALLLWRAPRADAHRLLRQAAADALLIDHRLLHSPTASAAQRAARLAGAWTINDLSRARVAWDRGCRLIISDHPAMLRGGFRDLEGA